HPSEFDLFLTANVRPREYLLADLAFQFVSLLAAVGMAAGLAAVAMVHAVGRPIAAALPMFGILAAYSALVHLTSQVLVVLRVRFPRPQADDVGRLRPDGPRLADGDAAAHDRRTRSLHDPRRHPDGPRLRYGPHDPLPSRPDLAGREHRVRDLHRAHRGPARGLRGHADRRGRRAHGHADPHVPPR